VPDMVQRQGQQPGYGLVSDPGMLSRASHGAPEFEQLKARMRSATQRRSVGPRMAVDYIPSDGPSIPEGPRATDDYFDLSKYNKIAEAIGRPTASSVDDLKRQAGSSEVFRQAAGARSIEEVKRRQQELARKKQELARKRSARSSSNRRNSGSRRQAARERQQELARRMSARSRSNRRNSRSRSTGDRRSGIVFGPGRSRRMSFRRGSR